MKTIEWFFWISIFIVFYTYLGYGIILYLLVKLKNIFIKHKSFDLPEDLPEVTLCIAAYNEQDIVKEKMANCLALNYPFDKLKITWITDGTNDGTNELLKQYNQVSVLFQPQRQGKTAALNRAINYIKTPLVVYTDANTMLNEDAIMEIVKKFANPRIGCVAGEKRIQVARNDTAAAGGEGIYWKYESFLKKLDSDLYSTCGAAGELFAIRTTLFEEMPNDTLLDDFILSLRIVMKGFRIAYCHTAYAVELGSANMQEEQKRKVRIAAGGLQSIFRLSPLLNIFKYGIFSFQYISHRVLRWSITPILLFLLVPLNLLLLYHSSYSWIFELSLLFQIIFYLLAYQGYKFANKQIKHKFFFVPYYFLFMNINVLKGFLYLKKKQGTGVWEKAKRIK